jgi:hypothetical protein
VDVFHCFILVEDTAFQKLTASVSSSKHDTYSVGTHFCPQSGEAEHFFNKNGTEESVHHVSLIFFVN